MVVRRTWHSLKEQFVRCLELPQDTLLDLPKVTLIGARQLQVENHRGVLEYNTHKIRINTTQGELVVDGARLRITGIFLQEMVIDGRINSVGFIR
ncbi:MAG TPA: sporulation protein YqfC [Firmicutes bacterium]|nr:sporulation protein YqfC [Bacillota bacterium]